MSDLLRYLTSTREAFQDTRRLNSLYGDFATYEHSNPEGYRANLDEWRLGLISAAREGIIPADPKHKEYDDSRFVLETGNHLLHALEMRQFGIPVALGKVVEDAVKSREFIELHDFITSPTSIYQRRWLPTIPSLSDILIWGWKQIGFGSQDSLPKGQWVIPANLEAASTLLLKHLRSTSTSATSQIHTLSSLRAALPVPFSDADLSLLLTYLTRDRPHITTATLPDGDILLKLGAAPISQTDTTIATLRTVLDSISSPINILETSIAHLSNQARTAVAAHNTPAARAALKRKKAVETALERRREQVFTLQSTLDSIDAAADNVALVRAMDASAGVLKDLNAQVGGVEGVEKVKDRLDEQMVDVEEISNVLNEGGAVDEGEVDEEFEALVKEQEKTENAAKEAENAAKEAERRQKEEAETARKLAELKTWEEKQKESAPPTKIPEAGKETSESRTVEKTTDEMAALSL
ncbi:hypothetical protein BT63DRAFT_428823 [Microthyrium microscopicum]|uniref:Snf7-domain-containing protein n=1 Tax=Microthyrium microscopicum TaxID=703497 RepID=A0A6A6TYF5_9PEZI|nr:hypothetical protein BT63DRAFT_428823 [Microthyrium microscopicum]